MYIIARHNADTNSASTSNKFPEPSSNSFHASNDFILHKKYTDKYVNAAPIIFLYSVFTGDLKQNHKLLQKITEIGIGKPSRARCGISFCNQLCYNIPGVL